MGKDKQGKPRFPKRVAGVKVPKKLRKTANRALQLADNPLAREAASAALVAGVTRLLASIEVTLNESPAAKGPKRATAGVPRGKRGSSADGEK